MTKSNLLFYLINIKIRFAQAMCWRNTSFHQRYIISQKYNFYVYKTIDIIYFHTNLLNT